MPLLGNAKQKESSSEASSEADIIWPPHEDDFIITLDEGGWNLGSVQGYNPESDTIEVQCLITLKTRAKDDHGKTYWMYASDDQHEIYRQKHILDLRPSVSLAKNIKRKDPVYVLLNKDIVEAISQPLYN